MDTRAAEVDVSALIQEIKSHMPLTYSTIRRKAGEVGNEAYALVRRGLRGEANCFYAFERGRVVGTPFALKDVPPEVAMTMVTFGSTFVCIWGAIAPVSAGAAHGAN